MKTYELTYIIPSSFNTSESDSIREEIESFIKSKGGVILKSDKTEAKTFSYNIKKQSSGYFVTLIFQISEDKLKEIKEKLEQGNKVLRHIIIIKRPVKEMKGRMIRRFSLRSDSPIGLRPREIKRPVFSGNLEENRKTDKVEVKEEEINKKLDEILSE